MAVFAGALKPIETFTDATNANIDSSWGHSWDTQIIVYTPGGRILAAHSSGNSIGGDGFVWHEFRQITARTCSSRSVRRFPTRTYSYNYNWDTRDEWNRIEPGRSATTTLLPVVDHLSVRARRPRWRSASSTPISS